MKFLDCAIDNKTPSTAVIVTALVISRTSFKEEHKWGHMVQILVRRYDLFSLLAIGHDRVREIYLQHCLYVPCTAVQEGDVRVRRR